MKAPKSYRLFEGYDGSIFWEGIKITGILYQLCVFIIPVIVGRNKYFITEYPAHYWTKSLTLAIFQKLKCVWKYRLLHWF